MPKVASTHKHKQVSKPIPTAQLVTFEFEIGSATIFSIGLLLHYAQYAQIDSN